MAHSRISESWLFLLSMVPGEYSTYSCSLAGEKKKKARENTSLGQEQVPQADCRWKTEGPGACDAQAGCDKGCKNRWETNTGCEESETPEIFFFFTVFAWDGKRQKLLGGARTSSAAVSSGVKIVTAQTP